eukprot:6533689-Heterocapsa_arctica.AAC.1
MRRGFIYQSGRKHSVPFDFPRTVQQHDNKGRLTELWWKHQNLYRESHKLITVEQQQHWIFIWKGTKLGRNTERNMDRKKEMGKLYAQIWLDTYRRGQ